MLRFRFDGSRSDSSSSWTIGSVANKRLLQSPSPGSTTLFSQYLVNDTYGMKSAIFRTIHNVLQRMSSITRMKKDLVVLLCSTDDVRHHTDFSEKPSNSINDVVL
jgi:hypothetical protein